MSASANGGGRPRVLVKEKIGDSGIELLREHFDVDLGVDWSEEDALVRCTHQSSPPFSSIHPIWSLSRNRVATAGVL